MNRKSQDFIVALVGVAGLGTLLLWAGKAVQIDVDYAGHFERARAAFGAVVEAVVLGAPETIEDDYAHVAVPPPYDPTKDALKAPATRARLQGAAPAVDYPLLARRNGWEGATIIHFTVDETGQPFDCRLVESSGHDVLDKASCVMITTRARYTPARDALGQPVISGFNQRIRWQLEE
ncbi:energy transducer TonB [Sphingobium sp. B11D3A]|uniref:energy transducer TonB n=1 Tax=Sphingobium sp. B11D3A TaxID=2940574 RepID=UPI002225002E|nr:energy transducer TonB [Sphingobium sp. B11D3A]MCW2390619.1 TonB family protein [Sphingobium sp. B11D3A]